MRRASSLNFVHANARVARLGAKDADAFQLEGLENVIRQGVTLLAVVREVVDQPRNARLGDGGVGGAHVHDGHFQFQRHAQRDVAVLPVDAAEHGPAVFIEEHLHQFGGRCSPQSRFVVNLQRVGFAFVSAPRVGLLRWPVARRAAREGRRRIRDCSRWGS